jgi:hypothetical protein
MTRLRITAVLASVALGLFLSAGSGVAQQKSLKDQLVGTWTLLSFESIDATGAKVPSLEGGKPKGLLIFTANGRMSLQIIAPARKIASNDRLKTTPEEDRAVAHSMLDYFGSYTVNESDKTISIKIEASTFPNQMTGSDAKRTVTVSGDELTVENARRMAGGKTVAKWQRVQ